MKKTSNTNIENLNLSKYFKKSDFIIVGVSTGIDSMSLLNLLISRGYKVVVSHINHKRRKESETEYAFLKDYCLKMNIPFEGYELTKTIKSNFQEEARYERYNFYKLCADKYNTKLIALAHHADDEAETILMRLTRGSFISAYSGIKEVSDFNGYKIIRPFLNVSKDDIKEYQEKYNIPYFEDYTNNENHYTRNIIRHEVVIKLKEINPSFLDSIKNFSEDLSEAYEHILKETNEFLKLHSKEENGSLIIDRNSFNNEDDIIKKEIILRAINKVSKDSVIATHERMREITKLSALQASGKVLEIKKDLVIYFEYDEIVFSSSLKQTKVNFTVNDFGDYQISDSLILKVSQNYHHLPLKNSYMLCYNDIKSVFPITIRNREVGDYIKVNGITKKVSDVLSEHKIPKRERDNVLVVLNKDGIFFIPNILRKETDKSLKNTLYITLEVKNDSR
ncbi:MAG: tRNA lysidine(34) synthetase TilS [Gammaproteobacteria bacterium]|nr:tRNA lysidine(34) synthetase TilS [Gammaproteobacteria bacterium]